MTYDWLERELPVINTSRRWLRIRRFGHRRCGIVSKVGRKQKKNLKTGCLGLYSDTLDRTNFRWMDRFRLYLEQGTGREYLMACYEPQHTGVVFYTYCKEDACEYVTVEKGHSNRERAGRNFTARKSTSRFLKMASDSLAQYLKEAAKKSAVR